MKKAKLMMAAFAVLAVGGSALALKANSHFNPGTVYCNNSNCPSSAQVAYTTSTSGTFTTPCGTTGTPYTIVGTVCTATGSGTTFVSTGLGE